MRVAVVVRVVCVRVVVRVGAHLDVILLAMLDDVAQTHQPANNKGVTWVKDNNRLMRTCFDAAWCCILYEIQVSLVQGFLGGTLETRVHEIESASWSMGFGSRFACMSVTPSNPGPRKPDPSAIDVDSCEFLLTVRCGSPPVREPSEGASPRDEMLQNLV